MSQRPDPHKPRPLGRVARNLVTDADSAAAAADRELAPMYHGDLADAERHVTRARFNLAELRRMLATVLGLGTCDENGEGK